MSPALTALVEMNLAAGAAIAFMLLVRKQARHVIGVRAVYLMWAIVPASMLATLIPARTVEVVDPTLPERIVVTAYIPRTGIDWVDLGFDALATVWAAGALVLAVALMRRQILFQRDANRGVAGPALVGFHYPRIVTPDDFAKRFSEDERKLIVTHEEVHLDHGDSRINALIALVRCICWFNPLVHIGARAMRMDQELACDAVVIERRPRGRRAYAETLLKTELAAGPLPVGCYWPPEGPHPLTERIAMLTRGPMSLRRRVIAFIGACLLTASGGVAAWAAQPERPVFKQPVEVYVLFLPIAHDRLQLGLGKADTEPPAPS